MARRIIKLPKFSQEDKLDRSHQGIEMVPDEILKMGYLKVLKLRGNYLEQLPALIFEQLPLLNYLDLESNHLKYIPTGIAYHDYLETLLLKNNKLNALPPEMGYIPNLKNLTFQENPIQYPPERILKLGVEGIRIFLREDYYGQYGKFPPISGVYARIGYNPKTTDNDSNYEMDEEVIEDDE